MSELSAPTLLTPDHDVTAFACGKGALDDFLKRHALANQKAKLSNTYVVCTGSLVVGYYTLALVSVSREDAPDKFVRGMPAYPVPCVLMARFAVDLSMQGRGLGRSLFTDALRRAWTVMVDGPAPARLFVVDAKDDEARTFYERLDMVRSPVDPMRLFLTYKTLQGLFGD